MLKASQAPQTVLVVYLHLLNLYNNLTKKVSSLIDNKTEAFLYLNAFLEVSRMKKQYCWGIAAKEHLLNPKANKLLHYVAMRNYIFYVRHKNTKILHF